MLTFRLYIASLALVFLCLTLSDQRFGSLPSTVVTCALVFLILDIRKDVEEVKRLEAQLASLQKKGG